MGIAKIQAKQNFSQISKNVIAVDLGGSKIRCGIVNSLGDILIDKKESVDLSKGPEGVVDQIASLVQSLAQSSKIETLGIASAGPLNVLTGELIEPTNLVTDGKSWDVFPIEKKLADQLNKKVILENDAAAAVLAEAWCGKGQKQKSMMLMTLGTGLGTGMIVDQQLVRAGRGLHPEAGHILIGNGDQTAPCGCGNFGCAEAYLSAMHFAKRYNQKHKTDFTAQQICQLAQDNDQKAKSAFNDYALKFAQAVYSYVVLYAPEKIYLSGSFSKAKELFLPQVEQHLEKMMLHRRKGVDMMPDIELSAFDDKASFLGGAYVAYCSMIKQDRTN